MMKSSFGITSEVQRNSMVEYLREQPCGSCSKDVWHFLVLIIQKNPETCFFVDRFETWSQIGLGHQGRWVLPSSKLTRLHWEKDLLWERLSVLSTWTWPSTLSESPTAACWVVDMNHVCPFRLIIGSFQSVELVGPPPPSHVHQFSRKLVSKIMLLLEFTVAVSYRAETSPMYCIKLVSNDYFQSFVS